MGGPDVRWCRTPIRRVGRRASLKADVWSLLIVYGSSILRHPRTEYVAHDHVERPYYHTKGRGTWCAVLL
jgi:hypothetical protein